MTADEANNLIGAEVFDGCRPGCLVLHDNHATWDEWIHLALQIIAADNRLKVP